MTGTAALPANRPVHAPHLDGPWTHVATRSYGTQIYRAAGCYVKIVPPTAEGDWRFDPRAEAARLEWLAAQGFPAPAVVEVGGDGAADWLVTTALAGRPADAAWSPAEWPRVVQAVAATLADLHALPAAGCPFDRTLAVALPQARRAVELGWPDLDDLDPEHAGWSGPQLLAELDATTPPAEDVVVCHGDPCLDNILIDPETLTVSGILDVGRLGRADRWLDLAIVLRDLGGSSSAFAAAYGLVPDPAKERFYRLLDEFV